MSFYYPSMYNASTFINIPNMCACLYNTAGFHYSNYLNSIINLHNCGRVSLTCVASSWSPVNVATALLPPSHLHVFLTDGLHLEPQRLLAAFEEFSLSPLHLPVSAPPYLCTTSIWLALSRLQGNGFSLLSVRLLSSTPDSWSVSWVVSR